MERNSILHPLMLSIFFMLFVNYSHARDDAMLQMLNELSNEDSVIIDANEIVNICNNLLEKSLGESMEVILLRHRAKAYRRLNKNETGFADCERVLKLSPNDIEMRCLKVVYLEENGKLEEAIQETNSLIRDNPKNPRCHILMAESLHMFGGSIEESIQYANQALELDPNYPEAFLCRGGLLFRKGDFHECLADLNEYIQLRPLAGIRSPDAPYCWRGYALLVLGRNKEALSNFLIARKINPSEPRVAYGLYGAYTVLNKLNLAVKTSEELISLDPDSPKYRAMQALAFAKLGRAKDANKVIKSLKRVGPPVDTDLETLLGEVSFELGKYSEALEYYEQALRIKADCVSGKKAKAKLLATCPDAKYRNGQAALKLTAEAMEQEKQQTRHESFYSWMVMAEANAECGKFKEAVEMAKKALDLAGPECGLRSDYLEELNLFENKKPYRKSVRNTDQ